MELSLQRIHGAEVKAQQFQVRSQVPERAGAIYLGVCTLLLCSPRPRPRPVPNQFVAPEPVSLPSFLPTPALQCTVPRQLTGY